MLVVITFRHHHRLQPLHGARHQLALERCCDRKQVVLAVSCADDTILVRRVPAVAGAGASADVITAVAATPAQQLGEDPGIGGTARRARAPCPGPR